MDPLLQINDNNIMKYKTGGKIISNVLDKIIKKAVINADIYDLCKYGDDMIIQEVNKVYKDSKNGISFPTNICKNNYAGNYCPTEKNKNKLCDGDLLKIELGCHIDGFPSVIGYTYIVGNIDKSEEKKINVINAVSEASKEILKKMKPGVVNYDLTKIMKKCAEKHGCNLLYADDCDYVPGVMSCQVSRGIIDGHNDEDDNYEYIHRFVLNRNNENYGFLMREEKLDENEVYNIDIAISSGTGKIRKTDDECLIYRKNILKKEHLKLQSSRNTLSKFRNTLFPINVCNQMNPRFKIGLKECLKKDLLIGYYPMEEKKEEFIARAKFTVIIKDNPILISGRSLKEQLDKIN